MLEIAGLIISGLGLAKDLFALHEDLTSWAQEDLEVDRDWLGLAMEKGLLSDDGAGFSWVALRRVPTMELKETHQVVLAHNDEKKILYRIVQGPPDDRLVLMKKTNPDA